MTTLIVVDLTPKNTESLNKYSIGAAETLKSEAEKGHATSIVKYEAGSKFSRHSHPLGEETFVLKGMLSDENSNYPAGNYLRNPKGYYHAPLQ